MATKNDERIMLLKKQVEEKKKELSGSKVRFSPVTNCVLDFEGEKYNLNVYNDKDDLVRLMIRLNMYVMSAKDLGISSVLIGGYDAAEWINDIKSKLSILENKKKEADLKHMEEKLDKLLSDDKRTELELDDIAALLGR